MECYRVVQPGRKQGTHSSGQSALHRHGVSPNHLASGHSVSWIHNPWRFIFVKSRKKKESYEEVRGKCLRILCGIQFGIQIKCLSSFTLNVFPYRGWNQNKQTPRDYPRIWVFQLILFKASQIQGKYRLSCCFSLRPQREARQWKEFSCSSGVRTALIRGTGCTYIFKKKYRPSGSSGAQES